MSDFPLILKNPENFYMDWHGKTYLYKETQIGCEDCPYCNYYQTPSGIKFKVRKCNSCQKN